MIKIFIVSLIILFFFKLVIDVFKEIIQMKASGEEYAKQKLKIKNKIKRPFD